MGRQQLMFCNIFKEEFSEIWFFCCLMRLNFSRQKLPKVHYIFGIFPKNHCFTLQSGLKWKYFEEF